MKAIGYFVLTVTYAGARATVQRAPRTGRGGATLLAAAASKARSLGAWCYRAGGGWMILRRDGVLDIEVRLVLETDDKQMIYMHWKGLPRGPKDVIDRLNRGKTVYPSSYYFRTTPYFETASGGYSWLNRICAIATGSRVGDRRGLGVYQVRAPS